MSQAAETTGFRLLDMNRYQWTVLFAAWLGWGFDVFDSLLFNFVAPTCVPTLLGLTIGSPEAREATRFWTGALSGLLLLGWAAGGILFGAVADRVGRTRTLMLTMGMYSVGTALCAFAPNIEVLVLCRIIASLGIGGEWAAGAAMVAEVVPEKRRVEAGALLYTSAPLGLFLATYVDYAISTYVAPGDPTRAWRYVFLCGLLPTFVALLVRMFVKEPERWHTSGAKEQPPSIRELFTPAWRRRTLGGLAMAIVALVMWWSCNAFIATIATELAGVEATARGLSDAARASLLATWKARATNFFNLGGLIGTLLTVPASKYLGRRTMFGLYFAASAAAIFATFGLTLAPDVRIAMYFLIGLSVFGVFGSFTYYLPELYSTRLRGTGSGFCYNAGRVLAAPGPYLVGLVAASDGRLEKAMFALFCVGFVPLVGLFALPWVTETKGEVLAD